MPAKQALTNTLCLNTPEDVVFHPLLPDDERIFQQEGWRYSLTPEVSQRGRCACPLRMLHLSLSSYRAGRMAQQPGP